MATLSAPRFSPRPFAPVVLVILTALLFGLLFAPSARATEPAAAARVAAASGQVTAAGADGSIRELKVDDPLFNGDIISTGPNSRVRLLFSDNGLIALRPSSRFVINDYQHSGDPEVDRNNFSLVRGGFRAVTGAIGQNQPDSYQINTPAATIGIRGTEHRGRYCAGDCFDLADIGVAAPPDGLYTGTISGTTTVGDLTFGAGEYGFTDPDGITMRLPEPPPILVVDPDLGAIPGPEEEEAPEETEPAPAEESPEEAADEAPEESPAEETPAEETPAEETPAEGSGEPAESPAESPDGPADQPEPEAAPEPDASPAPAPDTAPEPEIGGPDGSVEDFEIPARPPTVRAVDC